jgi:hypothetical protein
VFESRNVSKRSHCFDKRKMRRCDELRELLTRLSLPFVSWNRLPTAVVHDRVSCRGNNLTRVLLSGELNQHLLPAWHRDGRGGCKGSRFLRALRSVTDSVSGCRTSHVFFLYRLMTGQNLRSIDPPLVPSAYKLFQKIRNRSRISIFTQCYRISVHKPRKRLVPEACYIAATGKYILN